MWHFIRLFLFCLSLWGLSLSSQAATISVNTLADNTTSGDSLCTLREAIISANTGSAGSSGCTITGFGTSYIIQLVVTGTINLASELPAITSDITLKQSTSGASAGNFVIRGGVGFRIIRVSSGTVQFIDLSMVSGNAIDGGALYIDSPANVTLVNVAIQGNNASNSGGGIYNNGTLTLQTNSIVKSNTASISGGGIHNQSGTLTIDASQVGTAIDPNTVNGASGSTHVGGGIANFNGTLNINNTSKICSNTVVYSAGNALGGGIYSSEGTVTISSNSEVCNNSTTSDNGSGQSHGAGIYSVATIAGTTNLTIQSGSKVYGNIASGLTVNNRGGGIYQTGSRDLVISAAFIGTAGNPNTATYGAGIYNDKSNVTIQSGTEVCYNEASNSLINSTGGGIYNDTGNTNNQLQINNSTFCFNTTNGSSSSAGGAIANYGSGSNPNLVIQNNSQFYGNQVTGSPYPVGGAIYNYSTAGVTIDNSTIGTEANPNKAQDGAGIYNGAGLLTVQNNSIISYNLASGDGAGIYNAATLAVNNSTLSYNNATNAGGGINNSGTISSFSNSKLIYNLASTGSAFYQAASALGATFGTNNCIVQNFNSTDDVYNDPTNPVQSMNGVWWGSSDGASGGTLTGHGESISNVSQGTFLTTAPTGCPDPAYSSSPATGTINLGTTAVSTPITTSINITEGGNADLWVKLAGGSLASALTGTNAADFTVLGSFPLHVTQSTSQTITVQCTPSATGTRTATLTLETTASLLPTGNNQKIYNLQCNTPAGAGFSSTPTPSTALNFGSVNLGSSAAQNISVSETGSAALNVSLVSLSGVNASEFSVSGLPFKILDGDAARTIGVTCTPTAAGTRTATLTLSTDDPAKTSVSYPLSCSGVTPSTNPVFNSNPLPSVGLSFGNVSTTTGASQTISITNTGNAALNVSLSSLGGANAADFSVIGLPLSIVNGTPAQNITVSCKPSALGTRTATLNLNTNDPAQVAISYNLTCTAAGTTVCDTQKQIPIPQCNALLNLYNSTNGANWTDKASNQWLSAQPCTWAGVGCVAGQVISLSRSQQNLIGTLPSLAGLAASLTALNLSDNQLSGVLPDYLSFSKLQDLDLSSNLLSGAIIGLPSSLKTLRLDNNQLEGIIPDLTPLTGLNFLNLDFNKLVGETAGSATAMQATWRLTQTMMPTNVKATPLSATQVQVTWTLINYITDNGFYRVKYATTAGGPYTIFPTTTTSKSVNNLTVTGLTANTQYYFVVETITQPHLRQRSQLISAPSAEVAAKTLTTAAKFSTIPAIGSSLNLGVADFGNPSTSSVTVINLSNTVLTVSASISGTNAADFSVTPSSASIAGSSAGVTPLQQLFVVQCRPAATSFGALSATLNLATNDPAQANVTYPLSCQSNNKQVVNNPPTDITLSNSSISDSLVGGGLVGLLKTQDPDATDSFTYTLIDSATGVFALNGNELHTAAGAILDGATRPSYTIKVRSTDSGGLFIEKSLTISVLSSTNSIFTGEIASDSGTIASNLSLEASENFKLTGHIQPDNRHVGQSASILVTYTWNSAGTTPRLIPVTLAKNQVLSAKMDLTLFQGNLTGLSGVFNVHLSYRLDSSGKELGGDIARLELQVNHAPTDISLSATSLSEDSVEGSLIGKFSTIDADKRDHFVYGLVGTEQFIPFKIVGDELRVTNNFLLNAKTSPQYQFTVRSVDSFGSFTEKNFTINVQTADSLPTEIGLTNHNILEASHYGAVVGRLFTRERHPYSYQYELLDDAGGRFALHQDLLMVSNGDLLQYEVQPQHSVTVRSTNVTTGKTLEQSFAIDLINIPNIHLQASFRDAQGAVLDKSSFSANEFLNLSLRLYPESTHKGKTVDLILVGVFLPNDAPDNYTLLMLNPDFNLAIWDGDFAHLQSAGKIVLDAQHDFQLWNAALPAVNGKLAIFLGYRLDSGEVFYQPQAISLEIH
ncbi:MAG: choice-of-anchor D domain-containing protein [Thiotrichaceae bacterium]|nr:choice-of-anchor D domain-containing protein [Thiotrichaceae bacterium]